MMGLRSIPLIVVLMAGGALAMYLPAAHALVLRQHEIARAFFYSGSFLLILIAMVGIATLNRPPPRAARAHLGTLAGAYLILPPMLAVPFTLAVPDTSFANAWFEMLSSFTTTGATLYDTPGRLPPSVHLWRALVGWLGGFFVLTAAMAVLAPLSLGGMEVISGRVPGREQANQITRVADPTERLLRQSLALLPAYAGLTLALWGLLVLAGESGLVGLCHAMGTLSTSGISPVEGMTSSSAGLAGEVLIFVFLFFAISRRLLPGTAMVDRDTPIRRDPEVMMAFFFLLGVPVVLFLRHWIGAIETEDSRNIAAAARAMWGGLFTTMSFLTTTGYESTAWVASRSWSGLGTPGLILLGLAIVGGGVATTAGGVKLLRVYALYRHAERELERIVHPSSIGGQGVVARRLRREGAYVAWIFFMLFAFSIAFVTAAMSLTGLEFEPSMVLGIAALTTTGPLADLAVETPIRWSGLGGAAKMIAGAAMVVGRLETLAILALLAPATWRR
ncbi:TrkH family potassium uptake protein [Cereibacter sphaeroides]|uniref:TrkH family potassium uptake protein n=1 Tax=Cereibacter sphaeroides TaxID=1063 RepID=UPI001F47AC2F|nr:potassium transporter TrkG [Cereibacter sphaeroides]MCE6952752.1 TrkH family potassium uptake protein [Cereibacter sphaeroides]MCE6962149.1 TrkH family potassium uptake protein [Cereibacter sphaeroides]MCE6970925.1 TrkH family potassium uptake protein [Cereibacter sphaeroides]MCE6972120.1 TrkH family potassium uptake protein [Cereibacter sphaeroides]